ncbi:GNAT family N-acetyltransferase [Cytobacillus luteolus]|uniref:GNAT family N-acetyltransferase n=1 Tax=Litchfieldia luteola TaxID=682179 RepID=UPI001CB3AEBB|nr:GNAT family N-acetyltransferase [Cytobacillus luteolus]MBP1940711.1 RimJ/RimL family protein N-acetyltransferase [Cytobacillus luteolus]
MDIKIRTAVIEDASQIIEHTRGVIEESTFMLTAPEEYNPTIEKEEEWIRDHLKDGNYLLVAEKSEKIIAVMNFHRSKRSRLSHLGYFSISIQEAYCNMGIGRKLIEELLSWAEQQNDLEKVCLEVFSHNERAIHLYKKLGFIEEGRKVKFVKFTDDFYADEILMYRFV